MRNTLCAAVGVLLLPTVAAAQAVGPRAGSYEFTLSGTAMNDRHFDSGAFGGSLSLGYYATPQVAISLRHSSAFADAGRFASANSTGVAVDYHFDAGNLRPFVGAGFGATYGNAVSGGVFLGPEAGAKYYVNPTTFLFGQVAYQAMLDDVKDGAFNYGFGVGFNF